MSKRTWAYSEQDLKPLYVRSLVNSFGSGTVGPFLSARAAFYNLATGSAYFAGSLLSGYLSDYLLEMIGTVLALQIVYMISATGRAIGALTYTSITEPYKYPSTLKRELWKFVQRMPH